MDPEGPSVPDLPGGMGQHHVARWIADGLADTFHDDQQRRQLPVAGERQHGHCGHLDKVSKQSDRPELLRLLADTARNQAKSIAQQFSQARHDADDRPAGAQEGHEGTGYAAGALIREIGEKTNHPDEDNKLQGSFSGRLRGGDCRRSVHRRFQDCLTLLIRTLARVLQILMGDFCPIFPRHLLHFALQCRVFL